MLRKFVPLAAAFSLLACGSPSRRNSGPAPAVVGAPSFRLSDDVAPTHYDVRLHVIPDTGELRGTATIKLDVRRPVPLVWLHTVELEVDSATLGGAKAEVRHHGEQVAFVPERPLAAGPTELVVSWRGQISERNFRGVFRQRVDGAWYVFTQFESIEARRALPCFDEPRFKVPWRLTLEVPPGLVSAANTPIESERAVGPLREIRFAETPALPSYLLAFTVGPFDVVDGGVAGKNHTPLRYLVPRGRAAEAGYAAATNGKILDAHEEYYGVPYPFAKLDSVAVPGFGGAMENPGLITYSAHLMLIRPGEEAIARRRAWVSVASHEQAHQWFGNLVTMVWWDDIWLNEAFASWAGDKAMDRMMKEWDPRWPRMKTREEAMAADSLAAARKVRQPVTSNDGIGEAFDRITYDKGQTVLEMAEGWVGPEPFRQGVHEYLIRHARKNTTGEDFLRTIGEVTKHPELPGLLATFLEQGGLPSVSATLTCKAGEPPAVTLRQERFLAVPPAGGASSVRWSIPFCLRTPAARQCLVLAEREQALSLEGQKGCPKWLHLDADQRGYYHSAYTPEQLTALLGAWADLSPPERIGVLHDATLDVGRGRLPAGTLLAALTSSRLLGTDDPVTLVAIVDLYKEVARLARQAGLEPQLEAMVVRELGPRARALGWLGVPGDTDDVRLARVDIVEFVASAGEPALMAEAVRLADRVLRGEPGVPADVALAVLKVSAARRHTDVRPFLDAARKSKDAVFRYLVYTALAEVRDPAALALVREYVLSPEFEWGTRGQIDLVLAGHTYPNLSQGALDFVERHYDTLAERLPKGGAFGDMSVDLVEVGWGACDAATRDRIAHFFGPRNQTRDGGPRETAIALEKVEGCARSVAAQKESLEAFFRKTR